MANIDDMAKEQGTREVFLGHTMDDQYLCMGQYYGPGTVTVPNSVAEHLEESVRRVNEKRDKKDRVDPNKVTPRPVSASDMTDEELQAILTERGIKTTSAKGVAKPERQSAPEPEGQTSPPSTNTPAPTNTPPPPPPVV